MTDYTILSDLHLGDGGPLEDFLVWGTAPEGPAAEDRPRAMAALDEAFAEFLHSRLRNADGRGTKPCLLLLGDVFDLWQVRRRGESNRDALLRILAAHPIVVAALRHWVGCGGDLVYLLGNHDHGLVDSQPWYVLSEILPRINRTGGGRPALAWSDASIGLYAEHGHQWDPFNRFRHPFLPGATCTGERIVRLFVNPLEPSFPLIDKGATLIDDVYMALDAATRGLLPPGLDVIARLLPLVARASRSAGLLLTELGRLLGGGAHPNFSHVVECQHRERERELHRLAAGRKARVLGPPPRNLRFVATGHTHLAGISPIGLEGRQIQSLNPGTWRPLVHHGGADGGMALRQEATAITIDHDATGVPVPRCVRWEGGAFIDSPFAIDK